MSTVSQIKWIFVNCRRLEGEVMNFKLHYADRTDDASPELLEVIRWDCRAVSFATLLLQLVTVQEALTVRLHLIDGLEWVCITHEFQQRWGEDCYKAERTLKSYNQRALKKMAEFTDRCRRYYDFSWIDGVESTQ